MQPHFRLATWHDGLFVAQRVRRFYQRDGGIYGIAYDHASTLNAIADILERGVCVVGPASTAGAYIIPWPFNSGVLVAQVFFWCFEDSREIRVFDYLVEQCQARGATHLNVASLAPKHAGKQFYQKRGLKLVEGHYFGPVGKSLHGGA